MKRQLEIVDNFVSFVNVKRRIPSVSDLLTICVVRVIMSLDIWSFGQWRTGYLLGLGRRNNHVEVDIKYIYLK